jgi:pimeloyl-ACP methyl ester carboxylesterase
MMQTLTLAGGGGQITYRSEGEEGPPKRPNLLFIHNGGASSTIWRHQVEALSSRGYRTIIVDLPGFGSAPRASSGGDNYASQVTLLAGVLDELDVDDVLVVGNCMGSNLAVGLAESRPEMVRGLVLINPLTEQTFTHGWLGVLHSMKRYVPWLTRMVRTVIRRFVVPMPRSFAITALRLQFGEKGVAKKLHHDAALIASNQRRDQMPALMDVLNDMPSYGRIDRPLESRSRLPPVCTLWGEQNKMLSPRAGEHLNDLLNAERTEVLKGCGHFPMLEDPEVVTNVIDEFARAHNSATTRRSPASPLMSESLDQ